MNTYKKYCPNVYVAQCEEKYEKGDIIIVEKLNNGADNADKKGSDWFEVIVTNEILGNSRRIMSMQEIEKFNLCALACAKAALQDGKAHSMGMWTVSPVKNTEQLARLKEKGD